MVYKAVYNIELAGIGKFKYVRYLKANFKMKDSYNVYF